MNEARADSSGQILLQYTLELARCTFRTSKGVPQCSTKPRGLLLQVEIHPLKINAHCTCSRQINSHQIKNSCPRALIPSNLDIVHWIYFTQVWNTVTVHSGWGTQGQDNIYKIHAGAAYQYCTMTERTSYFPINMLPGSFPKVYHRRVQVLLMIIPHTKQKREYCTS